jgi:hypothetical protein
MKNLFLLLLLIGLLAAGWHYRQTLQGFKPGTTTADSPVTEAVQGTAATPPPATPHPAMESRATALKTYPGLGLQGSAFNKKFIELREKMERTEPAFLTQPDWPLRLAERTAKELGGAAMPPVGTPSLLKGPSGLQGSSLDQKPKKH